LQLRGRTCLVTGASSGIGWETARALARRGNTVVAVARRDAKLRELVAALAADAPKSFHLAGDLCDRAFAESIVEETVVRCGRIDVVVNNAAMPMHKLAYGVTAEDVERTLRTNFLSAVWTTTAALPHMLAQGGGAIVNVSSFASLVVPPREGVYAASKAALNAWTEGLWLDLAGSGVHVALVHPGPIDTEIWDKRQEQSGYTGKRWPARDVADAILRSIETQRHEVVVPRSAGLVVARWLRRLAPSLLRASMAKIDPVPAGALDAARARARTKPQEPFGGCER
jgi:short-subunit dehydrogenase